MNISKKNREYFYIISDPCYLDFWTAGIMIFLELVLQNFGPYAGKQVINLDTRIDGNNIRPIILLRGMNGGGKTTLMDAIRLALYGARAQCSTRFR